MAAQRVVGVKGRGRWGSKAANSTQIGSSKHDGRQARALLGSSGVEPE
jgi:hypothetical protein